MSELPVAVPLISSISPIREAIQLVDQSVDLPVLGLDVAGDQCPLMLRAGGEESFVQVEHGLQQLHHAVGACGVGDGGQGLNYKLTCIK